MMTSGAIVTCAFIAAAMFMTMLPTTIAQAPAPAPFGMSVPAPTPFGMSEPAAAPGPAVDCQTALLSMSDCLGFVEAGSNVTKPDPACCPELSGLLNTQPICLCLLLGDTAASFGIQIDLSKALALPSSCGLQTPSLSMCPAAPSPAEAPTSLREGPPAYSPGVAASPGSAANSDNGAATIAASGLTFLICLATAFSTALF